MNKKLVTAALPYVNNVPHLGNMLQVLSADAWARFFRISGYQTLYICGTDEYGTATETRALKENTTPEQLCSHYHAIHKELYNWFNIQFDYFGRTSTPEHTKIVQDLFLRLDEAGFITERSSSQLYCQKCARFLADRFVVGECPHCHYKEAKGDQCDNCSHMLSPEELIEPRCSVCGEAPVMKETSQLYLDLPALSDKLSSWVERSSKEGVWAQSALAITKGWLKGGLEPRAITRDLKWGVPVPKKGYENKVFYVWFDACLGYISLTLELLKGDEKALESWWRSPENVDLCQCIGKDNVPFHTLIFPAALLGSGQNWTMLRSLSSTEYLSYEGKKFSKSLNQGVFADDAQAVGIPADVWRFYLFLVRPEKSDYAFSWADFAQKSNKELIGNICNLINRTATFISKFYDGKIPSKTLLPEITGQTHEALESYKRAMERGEMRSALASIVDLSHKGNEAFQKGEPWKGHAESPEATASLIASLTYLIRAQSLMLFPFMPEMATKAASLFGLEKSSLSLGSAEEELPESLQPVSTLFFSKITDKQVKAFEEKFSPAQDEEKSFSEVVDLRAAHIENVTKHPDAERLYIIDLDVGALGKRTIVSSLVNHYKESELLGHTIIVVANLKPTKFLGVKSVGMLLAAENDDEMEVIFIDGAAPGICVSPKDSEAWDPASMKKIISSKQFFAYPITVADYQVQCEGQPLLADTTPVLCRKVKTGEVG